MHLLHNSCTSTLGYPGAVMDRAELPGLGDRLALRELAVSPYCLGMVGDAATVLAAFDAGINFFFVTADLHWPLYEPLRRGLEQLLARGRAIRDEIVVAAASYATQPEFCTLPFQEVIAGVRGLERLDVLIAGGAYGHELAHRLPVYRRHRELAHGGARAIGVSFHDRRAAIDPVVTGEIDLGLVRYNVAHRGACDDLFPHVRQRAARLYNFTSTAGHVGPERFAALGLAAETWQPDVTDHYRYVLGRPELDGILCSLGAPDHVASLADAIASGPLDEHEQQHLELVSRLDRSRDA